MESELALAEEEAAIACLLLLLLAIAFTMIGCILASTLMVGKVTIHQKNKLKNRFNGRCLDAYLSTGNGLSFHSMITLSSCELTLT